MPRNEGCRGAWGGGVPLLQYGFAELVGIALPGFRMVDDLSRDYVVGNIAAISKPKRYECHFVREPHDPDRLGVEPLAIEVGSDRTHPQGSSRLQTHQGCDPLAGRDIGTGARLSVKTVPYVPAPPAPRGHALGCARRLEEGECEIVLASDKTIKAVGVIPARSCSAMSEGIATVGAVTAKAQEQYQPPDHQQHLRL